MNKLQEEVEETVYNYFIENGKEPKDIDEDEKERIVQELFNTNERFCHYSLIDFLDNNFSYYCQYLEDYEEYESDFEGVNTAFPVDVMNRLWYIYGSRFDFDEIQIRMDNDREAETDEETEPSQ